MIQEDSQKQMSTMGIAYMAGPSQSASCSGCFAQGADINTSSQWESKNVSGDAHMVKGLRKQGFTLVEFLVVIGIIALLTGILVPCIGRARSMTKRTVCLSNLHSAAMAFRMYLDDNNRIMPPAARYPSLGLNHKKPIAEFLAPFIGDLKGLCCPADDGHRREERTQRYYETEGSSYEYWQQIGGKRVGVGYLTEKVIFNDEKVHEREVHVLYDYANFHGPKGRKGSVNYLYADGHIGDRTGE